MISPFSSVSLHSGHCSDI